jgi:hypothetical protein
MANSNWQISNDKYQMASKAELFEICHLMFDI